jgi:hypothetical protein
MNITNAWPSPPEGVTAISFRPLPTTDLDPGVGSGDVRVLERGDGHGRNEKGARSGGLTPLRMCACARRGSLARCRWP